MQLHTHFIICYVDDDDGNDDYNDDGDDDDSDDDDDAALRNDQDLIIVLSAKDFLAGGKSNEDPHDILLLHSTSHTKCQKSQKPNKICKERNSDATPHYWRSATVASFNLT